MKRPWPVVAVMLFTAVATLAPLAYASPPDPTWLPGLWDDGDHDDVVCLVTSDVGTIEPPPVSDGSYVHVVAAVLHADERSARIPASSSLLTRAPPRS